MRIEELVWLENIVEKLASKHGVSTIEVEAIFASAPHIRYVCKGRRNRDENVYAAYGQTEAGRYLVVFFIFKPRGNLALIISARDMDGKERKRYGKEN
ncbi:MAG: BrnT family toxin [Chloroflexota bacterium]